MELWPQGPLAVFLALVGSLNLLDGLSLPLKALQQFRTLDTLASSLSAVGGTAQVILGVLLVIAGIGLLWRAVSAWVVSVFLLVIMLAISSARTEWGTGVLLQAIALTALLLTKSRFNRRTAVANLTFSVIGIVAILCYGAFGSYLLGKGFRPQIHDLATGFYFTVVSLSTVGYGDIVPVSEAARWFAVSLLIIGLSVFASAVASALGPKISGELNRLFKPKEKKMQPKDHVILVGEGAIARNTIAELKRRGVEFVQIVSGQPPAAADHPVIQGEAGNEAVLEQAGIRKARMIIAAHEDDGENAFICLGAKELNPNVRVLAVASSRRAIRRLRLARADLVFSPIAVGSRLLADLVEGSQIAPEFHDLLEGLPTTSAGEPRT